MAVALRRSIATIRSMRIKTLLPVVAIALGMPSGSHGQTQLDLRTQTKSVDFGSSLSTRPFKTGAGLPVTCVVGDAFFKTDAAAGQNWFGCTSSNQWTQQTGSDSSAYSVVSFSSTPTFTAPGNHATTFLLLLTGDVNSSRLSGALAGDFLTFRICQDGTGTHAFTWPDNVQGAAAIDGTADVCTSQAFVFDGSIAQPITSATTTGISGSAITLPGSTSGTTTIQPSPVAGGTLTLPARTATLATTSGSASTDDCAKFDSSGNLVSAGSPCGSGGGDSALSNFPFFPFGQPHATSANALISGAVRGMNIVLYRIFPVFAPGITFGHMGVHQVVDEPGKHYTFAVYNSSKALVANGQCGTIASAASIYQTCAMPGTVNLSPGIYYLASSQDSTANTMAVDSTLDGYIGSHLVNLLNNFVFYGSTASTGTGTITMPSSFASDSLTTANYETFPHVTFLP